MDIEMVYTIKGNILKAKMETGVSLHITRIAAGAGRSNELENLETVIDIRQELTITGKYQRGTQSMIFALLSNKGLKAGYDLTMIGIYAEDPDDGEILYRVAELVRAFPISAEKDFPNFAIDCNFTDTVSNASQVNVIVDPAGVITASQFEVIQDLAQEAIRISQAAQADVQDALTAAQNKQSTIVSETQPNEQANGDLWLDTSDGPSDIGESGIVIANAVVSDAEPTDNPDLWLQTQATIG